MFEPQQCHFLSLSVWQVKKLPHLWNWSRFPPVCSFLIHGPIADLPANSFNFIRSFSQSTVQFPTIQPSTCKLSKMQTCLLAPVCQRLYCGCFRSVTPPCPTLCNPKTVACQASLSFNTSQSLLKLMSTESLMPSNHLIFCRPLLLLLSIFPCIRVFSNEFSLQKVAKVSEFQFQHQSFQWIFSVQGTIRLKCLFFMVFLMYYLCGSIICVKRKC